MIASIFLVTLCVLCTIFGIFILNRSEKVFKFRIMVNHLSYEYGVRHPEINNLDDCWWAYKKLPSYSRMTYSIEPLTLEYYFTDEEIEKLLNG